MCPASGLLVSLSVEFADCEGDGCVDGVSSDRVSCGPPGPWGKRVKGNRTCMTVCWGRGEGEEGGGLREGAVQWDEEKEALCALA